LTAGAFCQPRPKQFTNDDAFGRKPQHDHDIALETAWIRLSRSLALAAACCMSKMPALVAYSQRNIWFSAPCTRIPAG